MEESATVSSPVPQPSAIRAIFKRLAWAMLFGVALMGACIGTAAYFGLKLDASSKAYVDATLPTILAAWDVDKAVAQASPEMLASAPRERIEFLFGACARKLGPLREYKASQGDSKVSVYNGKKTTTAGYHVHAEFEHGPATIDVRLVQQGEQWRLLSLNVNSDTLLMP